MKKQLLIIEDCETMQRFLKSYFKRAFDLTMISTYQEAVTLLSMDCDVDAILMDINLPDGSGMELISRFKADRDYANIPIIALSGIKNKERQWQALDCGADDFVSKPFLPKELSIRLERLLARRKTTGYLLIPQSL